MRTITCSIALMSLLFGASIGAQQPPANTDHVAAVKRSLQTSMAALRQYTWVESTVISLKGEEKSRTQKQCSYGADGQLLKIPIGDPAPPAKTERGLRGRIAENKKEEVSASMKEAVALLHEYVPPDPQRIQAARDAGKLSIIPPDAAGNVQIVIKDYLKSGDSLTLRANAATDRLLGLTVATYSDSANHSVALKVEFSSLLDGTIYPENIDLEVSQESLQVAVENLGYNKAR